MGDYFSSVSTEMFRKFTSTALTLALLAALISASPAVGGDDQTRHDIILSHHPIERAVGNLRNVFRITTAIPTNVQISVTWQGNCRPDPNVLMNNANPYEYCEQYGCGKIIIDAVVNQFTCHGSGNAILQKDFQIIPIVDVGTG